MPVARVAIPARETMTIAARRSPTFKPGTQLKRSVEGQVAQTATINDRESRAIRSALCTSVDVSS